MMKLAGLLLALLLVLVIGFAIYVRFAPSDPAVWNVDPSAVERPADGYYLMRPENGDTAGPLFDAAPQSVLAAFDTVAMQAPRTALLAGSVAENQITYIARSRLWGFPDYVSVRAVPVEGGTRLAVFSRLRFGKSDMGVNRARIEDWIARVEARLDAS